MGVFGDLNRVELLGNVTQDLELRYTANGTAVMNFSIATNRSFKQGEDWQEEVTFHNIVVWSRDAEQMQQRAKKGTRVFVQGRLQTRSWEDAEGKKNYKTEIVSEKIILLDRYSKPDGDSTGGASESFDQSEPADRKSSPKKAAKPKKQEAPDEDIIDPDDLPF